ncbi:MAG: hypothetical protein AABZ06_14125 [Bdellovibrionota bacterium]
MTAATACCLPFLASCLNNNSKKPNNNTTSNIDISALPNTKSLGNSSTLTLFKVVKNQLDPSGTLDLIGDGTGAMSHYCSSADTSTGSPSSGQTTCNCTYTYVRSNGYTESFDVPTVYRESNMIRCKYDEVPSDITYLKIKIHLTKADMYSNEITYFTSNSGIAADLASPQNFLRAQRYQCKDIITIPYIFDKSIYDPVQSEDPRLSWPLNFYTTNMGAAIAAYASAPAENIKDWNCPAIPNDTSAGIDLTVYSVHADNAGSNLIYPPTGSKFDRSTFYLSRSKGGIFKVPLNAYIAPTVNTRTSGSPPPIGYGASPIPYGYKKEKCPNDISIPSGFHWVKVWLFRADLPSRYFRSSNMMRKIASISCNPGKYIDPEVGERDAFKSCKDSKAITDINDNASLAARVFTYATSNDTNTGDLNMCFDFDNPNKTFAPCNDDEGRKHAPGCTTKEDTSQFSGYYENFAAGTDVWEQAYINSLYNCGSKSGNRAINPLNLCTKKIPHDYSELLDIDLDGSSARYDFLFVVSPPDIMAADMAKSSYSAGDIYRPYRFKTSGDHSEGNKINYGIKLHDVSENGDPPANDQNRPGVFPVCALQPDQPQD